MAAKKPVQRAAEPAALIVVSVFREPGLAVPDAQVELTAPPVSAAKHKAHTLKGVTGARGEFVFRVSPDVREYEVSASARGYATKRSKVKVEGEGRLDVTFVLEPESK